MINNTEEKIEKSIEYILKVVARLLLEFLAKPILYSLLLSIIISVYQAYQINTDDAVGKKLLHDIFFNLWFFFSMLGFLIQVLRWNKKTITVQTNK